MDLAAVKPVPTTAAQTVTEAANHIFPKCIEFVQAHPIQSGLLGANVVLWLLGGPMTMAGMVLRGIGFGAAGPIAGKPSLLCNMILAFPNLPCRELGGVVPVHGFGRLYRGRKSLRHFPSLGDDHWCLRTLWEGEAVIREARIDL